MLLPRMGGIFYCKKHIAPKYIKGCLINPISSGWAVTMGHCAITEATAWLCCSSLSWAKLKSMAPWVCKERRRRALPLFPRPTNILTPNLSNVAINLDSSPHKMGKGCAQGFPRDFLMESFRFFSRRESCDAARERGRPGVVLLFLLLLLHFVVVVRQVAKIFKVFSVGLFVGFSSRSGSFADEGTSGFVDTDSVANAGRNAAVREDQARNWAKNGIKMAVMMGGKRTQKTMWGKLRIRCVANRGGGWEINRNERVRK